MIASISEAVTVVWNVVSAFLAYVFDFVTNPAIATIAFLPIVAVGIGLVVKLIKHKHKV